MCVLTGWGAAWLALEQRGIEGVIVVSDSRIQYRKAVTGDLAAVAARTSSSSSNGWRSLAQSGRASLPLACTIDQDGKRAVSFDGEYVVHLKKESHGG